MRRGPARHYTSCFLFPSGPLARLSWHSGPSSSSLSLAWPFACRPIIVLVHSLSLKPSSFYHSSLIPCSWFFFFSSLGPSFFPNICVSPLTGRPKPATVCFFYFLTTSLGMLLIFIGEKERRKIGEKQDEATSDGLASVMPWCPR